MKRKFSRKTALGFFRRKSLAILMAFLMVAPPITLGIPSGTNSVNNSIRAGALQTGKVDMASGNLAFSENLFKMNGYVLNLKYNTEGLYQEVSAINGSRPTGVVGLGWKLAKDRIIRLTHQTANTVDDEYILNAHGRISRLTFENATTDTIHYRVHSHPYWQILYLTQKEQWLIKKENGKQYIYGDGSSANSLISHNSNSTERSVRWGNWIGSSVVSNGQSHMDVAWNLSAIQNRYGQEVQLFYSRDEESVGGNTAALSHTKAAYLTKVIDFYGDYILLNYEEKLADEYEDPHVENTLSSESTYSVAAPDAANDRDAFQERYETQFLSSVERYTPSDVLERKIELSYDFIGQNKLKKRLLSSLQYLNAEGGKFQPSMQYSYYGQDSGDGVGMGMTYNQTQFYSKGALYGAIKAITIPGGGTYLYQYDEISLPKSKREFDIPFPPPYEYTDEDGNTVSEIWRAPNLFFMEDYVVVLHQLNAYDRDVSNVSICTWVGDHWLAQDFGAHEGVFFDRYHAEDYHVKNIINTIKTALMTGISDNLPAVAGLMNAFNDDITDQMNTIYNVFDDLSEGDIEGALEDYFEGNYDVISDIAQDIWAAVDEQITDAENLVADVFGIKTHEMTEQELADDQEDYNNKNPRKKFHISMQKDFFAVVSTAGVQSGASYNQSLHIFEKDPLVMGKWDRASLPVMISSKYMDINSGSHFVSVFDECLDGLYTFTRLRHRTWNSEFIRINQVLSDDELSQMSEITAETGNQILEDFGSLPQEDQDYINLLSINKRSAVSGRNNFMIVATSEADGSNARIQMFHHDQNKNWNWASPASLTFDKTLIPIDAAGDLQYLAQGLAANSLLDLKAGNSIAALQVYDNLNTEAYNDVMEVLMGGAGTIDGSTDPLNPFSSLQSDLVQDLSAMNATYGIVWNEDMDTIAVKLLHAGIGQTGMKMYINGNVIQKVGKAYSAIIGAQKYDENGTNYAFRYDGEKFISQTFQSDYFSSAMAPDIATQVNEANDKAYKTPEFQQYYANRPVTEADMTTRATMGNVTLDGSSLSSYNAFEFLSNKAGNNQWDLISNASQEEINAPEFVKEAIHLASDILNLVIQIIMMIIPFAQEIAAAEKIVSVIDKVTQVVGLAAMVLQPAADALVDKILGVNHKSTSIANNYLSTNGKLFARNPNGNWTNLGRAFQLADDDDIVGINNTLSNGYYNYTVKQNDAFEDPENNGETTNIQNYVTILKNRKIYRTLAFNQYVDGNLLLVRKDSLYLTGGNSAFVAYGPSNDDGYVVKNSNIIHPSEKNADDRRRKMSFQDATIIRLHRIADDGVKGALKDYVVRTVGVNTGYDLTYTHYDYDNATASYSDAHGAAIYPKVDVIPSRQPEFSKTDKSFGYTSYYFYNRYNFYGASNMQGYPASLSVPGNDPLVKYKSFDHRDAADFDEFGISTLDGRQYLKEVRDKDDVLLRRKIHCHLLTALDFFYRSSELLLDHVYQALSWITINELDGVVNRTVKTYDYTYDATVLRTVANHVSSVDGEDEAHYQSKTYAFEHYPDLLQQNRIKEVSFIVDSVRKGNATYVVDATATSYKKWKTKGDSIWDVEHIYKANFPTDVLDTSVVNYQAVAAESVAQMDADFANYDALLAAYETEIGNFSTALDAVKGANIAANDSHQEMLSTQTELVAAQHELEKSLSDLDQSNSELDQAQDEADAAKQNYDNLWDIYQDALALVDSTYAVWQNQLEEKEIIVTAAFVINPVAGLIADEVESDKVQDKYDDYTDALASLDAARLNADTAYDDYMESEDVLNSLNEQHDAIVEAVKIAKTSLKNALSAFDQTREYSQEALSVSAAAIQLTQVPTPNISKQAHSLSRSPQDSAVLFHQAYIDSANLVKADLSDISSRAKRFSSVASKYVPYSGSGATTSSVFGYNPKNIDIYPEEAKDITGDGIPDLVLFDGKKIILLPGTSSSSGNYMFGNVRTSYVLGNNLRATIVVDGKNSNRHGIGVFYSWGFEFLEYNPSSQNFQTYSNYPNLSSWGQQWGSNSGMRAGDFNGNGEEDLIFFLNNGSRIVYDLKSNTNFTSEAITTSLDASSYGGARWVADMNGDGKDDLIGIQNNGFIIHLSQGSSSNHSFASAVLNTDLNADLGLNTSAGSINSSDNGKGVSWRELLRLVDVSGDSKADVLRMYPGSPMKVKLAYTHLKNDQVAFTDLNVATTGLGNLNSSQSKFAMVDFEADGIPEIHIAYKHSTVTQVVKQFIFWFIPIATKTYYYHNYQFKSAKLDTDPVYNNVLSEVTDAKAELDTTITWHNAHITNLKAQKSAHKEMIKKISNMEVSVSDITDFDGQVYKWYKTHSILQRDSLTGHAITSADEKGVKSSDLYDIQGKNIVASIVDADFNSNEAFYCGFETYEKMDQFQVLTSSQNYTVQQYKENILNVEGGYNGYGSLLLLGASDFKVQPVSFSPNPELSYADSAYVISAFVGGTTSSDARIWVGADTLQYENAPDESTYDAEKEGWQYIEGVILGSDLSTGKTPTIHMSGDVSYLIDDLSIRPLAADFSAKVYNEFSQTISQINTNGLCKLMSFDCHRRLSTVYDRSGRIYGLNLAAFSREHSDDGQFDALNPNEASSFSFLKGGKAHYVGNSSQFNISMPSEQVAIHFVTKPEDKDLMRIDFSFLAYNVLWQSNVLTVGFGSKSTTIDFPDIPQDWTLAVMGDMIHLWVNGKLLHTATYDSSVLPTNYLSFTCNLQAASLQDQIVISGENPVFTMKYTNGLGQHLQSIRPLFDKDGTYHGSLTKARVYDGWGNIAISSLSVYTATQSVAYKPNIITDINWDTGRVSGDLSTYYASTSAVIDKGSDDHFFAYFGRSYEDNPLNRLVKRKKPGQEFYEVISDTTFVESSDNELGSEDNASDEDSDREVEDESNLEKSKDSKISGMEEEELPATDEITVTTEISDANATKVSYQDDEAKNLLTQFNLSPEKYSTKKTTNSLGHSIIEVRDKMGRLVMTKKGEAISQTVDAYNSSGFAKSTQYSPNYFAAVSPDSTDYASAHEQLDLLSLSDVNTSPDRGKVELIKDQKGKVIFLKTASSKASATSLGVVKYYRYDEQERVIEQGNYFTKWDKNRLSTIAKAPFCYDIGFSWLKRFQYDLNDDGDCVNYNGRIAKSVHRDGNFLVESHFSYDIYGQIITNKVSITDQEGNLLSEKEIRYTYYPSGQVEKITYPNGLEVFYSYNRQGKIKSIGTSSNKKQFASYEYDELDRVSFLTRKNGSYLAVKEYDLRGRNKDLKWYSKHPSYSGSINSASEIGSNANLILRQELEFFKGNQYYDTKISRLKFSGDSYTNLDQSYFYDAQNRLDSTRVTMNAGTALESDFVRNYQYDANSNVTAYNNGNTSKNIYYQLGTNQDQENNQASYSSDGLKVRFNSPIWGDSSAIAYNLYSHKAQVFYKSDFSDIPTNVWYKLSAIGYPDGVVTIGLKSTSELQEGDQLKYAAEEDSDHQLYRFVPADDSSGYHIQCKANPNLNLYRTSGHELVFDEPGSSSSTYYTDVFQLEKGEKGWVITSKGTGVSPDIDLVMCSPFLGVSTIMENLIFLTSEEMVYEKQMIWNFLPSENAIPESDHILFSHDAKNNRVLKIKDIVTTSGEIQKDTLYYIHGNNRLPLAEYFTGKLVDSDGNTSVKKTISNYIYGPEFGSICVRISDLDP